MNLLNQFFALTNLSETMTNATTEQITEAITEAVGTAGEAVTETVTDAVNQIVGGGFRPEAFIENLKYMGAGMIGIFLVIGVIILTIMLLGKLTAPKKQDEEEE
ncbi:MAG: hypothetical protein IJW00_00810 [Clostridia bacterium]|nr:hypothetical protein [Clostridia bacterium]